MKALQALDDIAERNLMSNGRGTVSAAFCHNGIHTFKFAVMLFAFERIEHFFNQVVDKEQLKLCRRVIYLYRKVVRHIMAEGRDCAVIIRTSPLTDKVRKTIYENLCARFLTVCEKKVLARLL